jgi:pimeloyl-ACP methyl ester carboxylesterase
MAEEGPRAPTRRDVVGTIAAGTAVVGTLAGAARAAQVPDERKTFVLVHGASAGGWCWRRVADLLEAEGHKVFTPTLTGLGNRSHLMSGQITLDTHITDVANVLRWERLENVLLCGHSYGGWIISGVAERAEGKISSIVYLDAFMPEDGQRVLDTNSDRARAEIAEAVRTAAVSRPPPDATVWAVNEKDRAWFNEMATPQPVGVAFQPLRLTGARERVPKKTYVRALGYASANFDRFYAAKKSDPSWRTYEVDCGHEVMIDAPERCAEILIEVA